MARTPPPRFGVPAGYCVPAGKRNKQAKDKQMTFTAIVWSKEQFVPWRCAACLLSRKDCSVMKKINSTNNAEQPRPPALNRWVALSAFGDRRELLHECAKPRPHRKYHLWNHVIATRRPYAMWYTLNVWFILICSKTLRNLHNYDIINMPNKLNSQKRKVFFIGKYFVFSYVPTFLEFGKNTNSTVGMWKLSVLITFVWRQSEFVLFVRQLQLPHFFILGVIDTW